MALNVTRYEPWALHREFFNEFNRLFERDNDESNSATAEWAPSVDIDEHAVRLENAHDLSSQCS